MRQKDRTGYNARRRELYRERGREDRRERNLQANYGMTLVEYDRMLEGQEGVCKLCGGPPGGSHGRFHVDHNHKTGEVRGLLCYKCNIGLGSFDDSPDKLAKAISYLTCRQ